MPCFDLQDQRTSTTGHNHPGLRKYSQHLPHNQLHPLQFGLWSWSWSFLLVKKTLLITDTCTAVNLACRHPLSSPKWPSWTQYCHHWGLSVCARFGDLEFFLTCTTWWFGVHGFCKPVFQPQAILNSVLRPPLLLSLCTTWWFGVHGLCQPI